LSFHTTRVIAALKFVEATEVWHPIKSDWRDGATSKGWLMFHELKYYKQPSKTFDGLRIP
jgi:hypothetical protein